MTYVKDIINNFKKEYGADYLQHYFAWQNANPKQAQKALKTAKTRGDTLIKSLAKTVKGKMRVKNNG